jgi:hypothetical protein
VLQELWDLFPDDQHESNRCSSPEPSKSSAQLCMFLSKAAMMGLESPRSMTLLGQIQGNTVLILMDSGSSHTFISNRVAAHMSGISVL